jgi:hypothetical protein
MRVWNLLQTIHSLQVNAVTLPKKTHSACRLLRGVKSVCIASCRLIQYGRGSEIASWDVHAYCMHPYDERNWRASYWTHEIIREQPIHDTVMTLAVHTNTESPNFYRLMDATVLYIKPFTPFRLWILVNCMNSLKFVVRMILQCLCLSLDERQKLAWENSPMSCLQ